MTDHADLIRRLEEAAKQEDVLQTFLPHGCQPWAEYHDNRAALLREAAKALGGE